MRNLWSCAVFALPLYCSAAGQDNLDAHVMLTVSEPGPRGVSRQSEFSKQAKPGVGKQLVAWIASSSSCRAVIVTFDRDGRVPYAGLPSLNTLKANEINQLPSEGATKWTWEGPEHLAEVDIVLIAGDPPNARELIGLVQAMHDRPATEVLRKQQDARLRQWLDGHQQERSSTSDYSVKPSPEVIGGMMRAEECNWCKSAQKVSIPPNGFSILRIHMN